MRNLAILLWLTSLTSAHAGLYAPDTRLPQPRRQGFIRGEVIKLRDIATPPPPKVKPDPDSWRSLTQKEVRRFEAAAEDGRPLLTSERATWAAGLIRLGEFKRALEVLGNERSPPFLIRANRATAHFLAGNLDLALRDQENLIAEWPAVVVGWSQTDLHFARQCELAFLRLLRSRDKEARFGGAGALPLDPIFPGFRVESREGDYEPGELPQSVADQLPNNAGAILIQLVFWLPHDDRLLWQFGEFSAVIGRIDEAVQVLDNMSFTGGPKYQGFLRHRRAVKDALELMRVLWPKRFTLTTPMVLPQATLAPGIAGPAMLIATTHALNASGVTEQMEKLIREGPAPIVVDPPPPPVTPPPLPFNWRHITASFAFGFFVAALVGFQLQEWRRRTQQQSRTPESMSGQGPA